jgi:hypothetical protein
MIPIEKSDKFLCADKINDGTEKTVNTICVRLIPRDENIIKYNEKHIFFII